MIKGFRDFISKGNVIDLAVGVIMGGAFGAVVSSLVADVLMPIIGMIFGSPDFTSIKVGSILIGNFITALVNFLLVAAAVYFFIVVPINELKKRTEKPAAPAEPPADIKLLAEIRDLLSKR
jgi:large conductance mechanosensitive channel